MNTVLKGPPIAGITSLPAGQKNAKSVPDIEPADLIANIESDGVRLCWSRAADCPCIPINSQTQQPDPNCAKCKGRGVFYFGPKAYKPPAEAGTLDSLQKKILALDGGAVIEGVVSKAVREESLYDTVGTWIWGVMKLTVRPENGIAYFDRLVSLDSVMAFSEVVTMPVAATVAAGQPVPLPPVIHLRYPAIDVNNIETLTARYVQGADFTVVDGNVQFMTGRAPVGLTLLSVHYNMHPVWKIIDHPHAIRETKVRRKQKNPKTPLGNPTSLPIQGHIHLEFLPVPGLVTP